MNYNSQSKQVRIEWRERERLRLTKTSELSFLLQLQYSKHLFVHIDQTAIPYQEAPLEQINIEQIYDKFPQSNVGLNELLVKGPAEAFYVVKFWVRQRGAAVQARPLRASPRVFIRVSRLPCSLSLCV